MSECRPSESRGFSGQWHCPYHWSWLSLPDRKSTPCPPRGLSSWLFRPFQPLPVLLGNQASFERLQSWRRDSPCSVRCTLVQNHRQVQTFHSGLRYFRLPRLLVHLLGLPPRRLECPRRGSLQQRRRSFRVGE